MRGAVGMAGTGDWHRIGPVEEEIDAVFGVTSGDDHVARSKIEDATGEVLDRKSVV